MLSSDMRPIRCKYTMLYYDSYKHYKDLVQWGLLFTAPEDPCGNNCSINPKDRNITQCLEINLS